MMQGDPPVTGGGTWWRGVRLGPRLPGRLIPVQAPEFADYLRCFALF
jgi:hypothetical protein